MTDSLEWLSTLPTNQAILIVLGAIAVVIVPIILLAYKAEAASKQKLVEETQQNEAEFERCEAAFEEAVKTGDLDPMIRGASRLVESAGKANKEASSLARQIYDEALTLVEKDSKYRRYALEMGRLWGGASRPDGAPSIYDEQAIKNDIEARLS